MLARHDGWSSRPKSTRVALGVAAGDDQVVAADGVAAQAQERAAAGAEELVAVARDQAGQAGHGVGGGEGLGRVGQRARPSGRPPAGPRRRRSGAPAPRPGGPWPPGRPGRAARRGAGGSTGAGVSGITSAWRVRDMASRAGAGVLRLRSARTSPSITTPAMPGRSPTSRAASGVVPSPPRAAPAAGPGRPGGPARDDPLGDREHARRRCRRPGRSRRPRRARPATPSRPRS